MGWQAISMFLLSLFGLWVLVAFVRAFVQLHHAIKNKPLGRGFPSCPLCQYDVRNLRQFECPECGADLMEVGIVGAYPPLDNRSVLSRGIAGAILIAIGIWIATLVSFSRIGASAWAAMVPAAVVFLALVIVMQRADVKRRASTKERAETARARRDSRRNASPPLTPHPPH
jgi:hypothetical protein